MTRYVLDTNVYIRALRNPASYEELERFGERHLSVMHLSSVVFHELLRGATKPAIAKDLVAGLAGPFTRTNRVVVPHTAHGRGRRKSLPSSCGTTAWIVATCRRDSRTTH